MSLALPLRNPTLAQFGESGPNLTSSNPYFDKVNSNPLINGPKIYTIKNGHMGESNG